MIEVIVFRYDIISICSNCTINEFVVVLINI